MAARPVVVIIGPTASGKSHLALDLAVALGGVVINADALQLYRALPILTAQPNATALARAPHRLYSVLDHAQPVTAESYRALAVATIAGLSAAALPIVVGGSFLYIRALTEGLAPMPAIPPGLRERATQRREQIGAAAFHDEIGRRDPAWAARHPASDRQRMIRAWEVFEATGTPLSDYLQQPRSGAPPGLRFRTVVVMPERVALYRRIDQRFAGMAAGGALDELAALLAAPSGCASPVTKASVMKALGARELAGYLAGTMPLEAAIAAGQQASRNYAKRQITWLRHQLNAPHEVIADPVAACDALRSSLASWRAMPP